MVGFVIKMVVDHRDIGDVIVGTLAIEKHHWECYPVEDDAQHILGDGGTVIAPAALAPPAKAPASSSGAFAVVERTVRSGKRVFREIRDACVAAGYSKTGIGSMLVKAVARGLIVQNENRKYFMPDERPDLVENPPFPRRNKVHARKKRAENVSSQGVLLTALRDGPAKRPALAEKLAKNGYAASTAGPTLSKMARMGLVTKTADDYFMLTPQYKASAEQSPAQPSDDPFGVYGAQKIEAAE